MPRGYLSQANLILICTVVVHKCSSSLQGWPSETLTFLSLADVSGLEGAVGYTPPPEEKIPDWALQDQQPEENQELNEIRRRRLQRFSNTNSQPTDEEIKKDGDIDLD